ncbi:MAG: hypothetical protein ABR907_13755 [Terracidiphilus sp.]|jgi:hypothetical protein
MNQSDRNPSAGSAGNVEFESTLRLLANLPAPAGLQDRVQAGLLSASRTVAPKARILAWPVALRPAAGWMQSSLARSVAAAAIFAVVIGGGWSISSRLHPAQPASAFTTSPRVSTQGGFSSAGAMRTPQTLNGPIVVAQPQAQPAPSAPLMPIAAAKPGAPTPLHSAKPVEAINKADALPVASATK